LAASTGLSAAGGLAASTGFVGESDSRRPIGELGDAGFVGESDSWRPIGELGGESVEASESN
jgi:hypothetical protein